MNTNEFKEKLQLINPNIEILGEYKDHRSKIKVKCKICGYEWSDTSSHLYSRSCRLCRKEKLRKEREENFKKKANIIHNNKYNYDKVYLNTLEDKVTIICPIHKEFELMASSHLKGIGCPKCSHRSYKYTTEEWILKANEIHNNKYDYSKVLYKTKEDKVCIICSKHGEFWLKAGSHILGYGCEKCGKESMKEKTSSTIEEFIEKARYIHGNKYDYSKVNYVNSSTKVCIICHEKDRNNIEHGEFWQIANNHLSKLGCPKCKLKSQTKLYEKLKESFPNEEILFEVGRDIVPWLGLLRFDIYFPKYNIAVEYNGEQHYIPIEHFGGEIGLNGTKERDKLKRNKCKENNCLLFEIKYNYTTEDYNNLVIDITNIINK